IGNTLDLTFSNILGAQSLIAPHLNVGSDHRPIFITLPMARTFKGKRQPTKPAADLAEKLTQLIPLDWATGPPTSVQQLKERSRMLCEIIYLARPLVPTSDAPTA